MATTVTKTCDRCGTVMTPADGIEHTPLILLYRETPSSDGQRWHFTSEEYDVCMRCQNVIHDVIHGKVLVTKC